MSKNPEKERINQYVLKHSSSASKDRSNSIITRSEIPYVPAKGHAASNSTHDSRISPDRLQLSIRAEGQSRRLEISVRPRTTTKLTVNLNSIPALRREKRDRGRGSASLTRLVPQRPRDIMAWPAFLIPVRGCQLESSRWCLPETSIRRYTPPFPVRLDLIEKNSGYIGVIGHA